MKTLARIAVFLISISVLTACNADILYRLDIHTNNTATMTFRETFDSELYQLALESGSSDPFGIDAARKSGWKISQRDLPGGKHRIELQRVVPIAEVSNAFNGIVQKAVGTAPNASPKIAIAKHSSFFFNTYAVHMLLPPMLADGGSSQAPIARLGETITASIIALHFQLRAPGAVVATNGTQLSNGYVQWDLRPNAPTPISYIVKVPAVTNIVGALVVAFLAIVAAMFFLITWRRRSARQM